MKIHDVKQGSQEWLKLRLGKLTGSKLKDLMAKDNLPLIDELISEQATGIIEQTFVSYDMQVGIDREPIARNLYSSTTGYEISEIGFVTADKYDFLGCSPDGVIIDNFTPDKIGYGAIEIKCPRAKTHCKYIRMNQLPNEYKYQVYNYFLCMENLDWLDFVSFNPDFLPKPLWKIRIERADILNELNELESAINKFMDKLDKYKTQILF